MDKFDLVLQGPIYDCTAEYISNYCELEFIENIIVSTWRYESSKITNSFGPKVKLIFSEDVEHPGIGNVNRQLKSSLEGVKMASNTNVIKIRTDQFWFQESMYLMYEFYNKYKNTDIRRIDDAQKPYNKIFVSGYIPIWNFGCSDHIYWGHKSDMIDLFDIPCNLNTNTSYLRQIRAECYIALNYFAKFDIRIKNMLDNLHIYCYDSAPKWKEANEIWIELSSRIMKPFATKDLHMKWPKYNLMEDYHWDFVQKELLQWGHEKDPHYN